MSQNQFEVVEARVSFDEYELSNLQHTIARAIVIPTAMAEADDLMQQIHAEWQGSATSLVRDHSQTIRNHGTVINLRDTSLDPQSLTFHSKHAVLRAATDEGFWLGGLNMRTKRTLLCASGFFPADEPDIETYGLGLIVNPTQAEQKTEVHIAKSTSDYVPHEASLARLVHLSLV